MVLSNTPLEDDWSYAGPSYIVEKCTDRNLASSLIAIHFGYYPFTMIYSDPDNAIEYVEKYEQLKESWSKEKKEFEYV